MKEMKGIFLGASITGMEGGSVVCDDLGNNVHYTLAAVDANGAVQMGPDGRYQRLDLSDRGVGGVEIHLGVNNNPIVGPGMSREVRVGSKPVSILGTPDQGVTFNGNPATPIQTLGNTRYP